MIEWIEKQLGEIAPFKYGKPLREENRQIGKYNVYSSAGICGLSDDNLTTRGIIIGRKGTAGSLFYSPTPFFCIDTAFYIDETADNCDIKFIYYYMQLLNLGSYNNDAAVPGLNRNLAHKLKIFMPPLSIQIRIAEILSTYDDAIENNNRRIALLEKAAQELYREWFVRFRFHGYKKAKFVNGLPERWEVIQLGEIINITSSKRIYMSDYVEEGIPFYRSKEVIQTVNGEVITEPLFISVNKYNELKAKFGAPCENDILITSVGTIGISFLVDKRNFYFKDGNLTWLQSGLMPNLALFIFFWLNSDIGKSSMLSSTIGTSQSALTIENLNRLKIMMPNKSILDDFYKYSWELIQQKRVLLTQSQNLARQRDLLLPRLMSGKLEV